MVDIDNNWVLEVEPGRTRVAVANLRKTLDEPIRNGVEAFALNMWRPFMKLTREACPSSEVVIDKFYVSKYLRMVVDRVRQQKSKELIVEDFQMGKLGLSKRTFDTFGYARQLSMLKSISVAVVR